MIEDVFHDPIDRLNDSASKNIPDMSVTEEVFQSPMGPLNDDASWNI
ncbi:MAG: hypothetical protein J07HX64_01651 [halophilic archaeon J07HX64]|nr:MAG: hypothetical protein J07HX64_01651 [halophilic archaeon J07HX64]